MASTGNPSGAQFVASRSSGVSFSWSRKAGTGSACPGPCCGARARIKPWRSESTSLGAPGGLQDAVHRESVREEGRIGALEKRAEPSEISRALDRDARERGLDAACIGHPRFSSPLRVVAR